MYDDFRPNVRKLRLSPRSNVEMHHCQSVGYFWGDIPSVLVEVGGDIFELKMGQCIPVVDRVISVRNPYSRSASIQISVNVAPQFQPSADLQTQNEFVTYRGRASIDYSVSNSDLRGVMLMSTDSPVLLELSASLETSFFQVISWTSSMAEHLDNRPTAIFSNAEPFQHPKTAVLETLVGRSGRWNVADFEAWLANAGEAWATRRQICARVHAATILMEPHSSILVTDLPGETRSFSPNFRVRELPSLEAPRG